MTNGASAGPISPHRISALRFTYQELHAQHTCLLSRLRVQMDETLSHRERLREEWDQRAASRPATRPSRPRLEEAYGMTPREAEVASLLVEGLSNGAVARRLGISPHTARHHTQRVLGKLGAHSRAEAGAILRR
jgi:DNA-binding CsgD family transcriptional regulator